MVAFTHTHVYTHTHTYTNTVDTTCMARVLGSDKLCVYKEETILCVWALWCGGIWVDVVTFLGCSCDDVSHEPCAAEVRPCMRAACMYEFFVFVCMSYHQAACMYEFFVCVCMSHHQAACMYEFLYVRACVSCMYGILYVHVCLCIYMCMHNACVVCVCIYVCGRMVLKLLRVYWWVNVSKKPWTSFWGEVMSTCEYTHVCSCMCIDTHAHVHIINANICQEHCVSVLRWLCASFNASIRMYMSYVHVPGCISVCMLLLGFSGNSWNTHICHT